MSDTSYCLFFESLIRDGIHSIIIVYIVQYTGFGARIWRYCKNVCTCCIWFKKIVLTTDPLQNSYNDVKQTPSRVTTNKHDIVLNDIIIILQHQTFTPKNNSKAFSSYTVRSLYLTQDAKYTDKLFSKKKTPSFTLHFLLRHCLDLNLWSLGHVCAAFMAYLNI